MRKYLETTFIIDTDNEFIQKTAHDITSNCQNNREKAVNLFYFVRDQIAYNLYVDRHLPKHFVASATLTRGQGFCIQKAVVLVALCRTLSIPGRLGFAVIRNHLMPEKLARVLVSNEIPDHGYAELHIEGKWVKATPAFDLTTCHEHRIVPVDFDGVNDAVFHRFNQDGALHIEYVKDHGRYADLPVVEIEKWVASAITPEAQKMILNGRYPWQED